MRRVALLAGLLALLVTDVATAQTLKSVRERGMLACGVTQGLAGFSLPDARGQWSGFDVDICRAIAAAIFGDPAKVTFVPLTAAERFEALRDKRIDVLSRNSTWTMGRETDLGLLFAAIAYYDGQGFLVPKGKTLASALELDGARVCAQAGTTSVDNAGDFFTANAMVYTAVTLPTIADVRAAYADGRCDAFTADVSQLYAERLKLAKPADHVILPDVISKEPLGPAVRADDVAWFNLVKWITFALVNAEELGVGQKTIDEALKSSKPDVRRLVGTDGAFGEQLGLTKDWATRAIRAVGNYGEIYDRNVGAGSPLAIPRGLNHLWSMGGILYAPPIR